MIQMIILIILMQQFILMILVKYVLQEVSYLNVLFLQDVLSVIGSPNSVYYKTDDKIKIHNPSPTSSSSQRSQDKSDFYYNYVNFGMVNRILITLKRFLLFVYRIFCSMDKVIQWKNLFYIQIFLVIIFLIGKKREILFEYFSSHFTFSYFPCNFELIVRNHVTGKEVIVTPSTRVRIFIYFYW